MKYEIVNNKLLVFLNNKLYSEFDFFNESKLQDYFRKLFIKLKDNFGLDIYGCCDIDVYFDDIYGVLLEISFNDDVYELYNDVDMSIKISKYRNFLYKVNDYYKEFVGNYYSYMGELYFKPCDIDYVGLGKLIENSKIIYGEFCSEIIKNGMLVFID